MASRPFNSCGNQSNPKVFKSSDISSSQFTKKEERERDDRQRQRDGEKMPSRTAAGIRKRSRGSCHIVHIHEQQHEAPPKDHPSSTPWRVFRFGIPILFALLQLHFHDSSPINTHPVNMWTAVLAGFICSIALGRDTTKSSRSFGNISVQVGYVSGLLAIAALISVAVPPCFQPFVFVIWMFASTIFVNITRNWIWRLAKKFFHFAMKTVSYVHSTWKQIRGNNDNIGTTTLPM